MIVNFNGQNSHLLIGNNVIKGKIIPFKGKGVVYSFQCHADSGKKRG